MISMGDELDRTQFGNNNAYCHDEPWNWLDSSPEQDPTSNGAGLKRFVSLMADFRRRHGQLHRADFFAGSNVQGCGYPDIGWHGVKPFKPDWRGEQIACLHDRGRHGKDPGPRRRFHLRSLQHVA